jgi:amidase
MTELWQLSATEMATAIRTGEASSREVLASVLARADAINPVVNAIVRRLDDEAYAAADAADAAIAAGAEVPALHGVPCTVKENIDVAGTPTTQGVRALADAIAPIDAPIVARMRAAGAIPFARTNLPDFGLRVHTDSDLHGITNNPWALDRTAGGSSGGEGAALATGMSPIGLGNDIGGSLRNPAHCCGIASIKPSTGVVPSATVIPPTDPDLASQLMAVDGPMARRVADVRLGLRTIAGAHVRDPFSLPVTLTDSAPTDRLRIAVMSEPPAGSTDPGIAAVVRAVADRLDDAGHDVVEATPPEFELVVMLWAALLIGQVRAIMDDLTAAMGEGAIALLRSFDEALPATTHLDQVQLHTQRAGLMRAWSEFYATHPVILCPVWCQPAFRHGADVDPDDPTDTTDTIRAVTPANFLGTPSAVVPGGTADGLPVGVQVMGDRFTDLRCLTVAAEIEELVGTLTPIDPVDV